MNPLRQIWTATMLALAALPQRAGAAVVTVIGVATAVAVMTSILAMGAGVRRFVDVTDQPERAVVLSSQSPSEFAGAFTAADVANIASAPGIRTLPDGRPMVQPLAAAPVQLTRRSSGIPGYAFLRGTGRVGDAMNKTSLRLVAGRRYGLGLRELVVGREVHDQYEGVDLGDQVLIHGAPWTVVGIYQDQGGIDEAGLAGDVEMVKAALNSPTYQSVGVMLKSPADFDRFRDAVMTNPQLHVKVERLSKYYDDQMSSLRILFDFVGYFVGGLMAVGAVCGAVTTLFAAVDARSREIATLRAIGFGGGAVLASVLIEALALAVPGALIGLGIAALAFNGQSVATGGLVFKSALTPALALIGVGAALAIGFIGGLFPAARAAGAPIAEALRAT
ncbi:MAG TPA: ABC transporter permease [Caulobacteraceae bacterium]|nr:ABC transporter permease [Caulobacteraceae bacterium]